jgi:hypothetical protein
MKAFLVSCFIYFISWNSFFAQVQDTLWTKSISAAPDGYAISNNMIKCSSSEFIVVGHYVDSLYIVKLNVEGETVWEKFLYETSRSIYGAGVDKDEFGNIYLIVWDYFSGSWWKLIKFNAVGDSIWSYTINDQINSTNRAQSITVDSNYIYIAATKGYGPEYFTLYKFNLEGDFLFDQNYTTGGSYNVPHSITSDSEGKVILAGEGGLFQEGGYILKCNTNGDTLWSKSLNGIRIRSALTDSQNNIIVTGWSNRIIKFDPVGNVIFDKPLGDDNWSGNRLIKYDDATFFVIGAKRLGAELYAFDIFLAKYFNESGDSIWTYIYDYPEPTYGATGQDGAVFFDTTLVILSHCFTNISGGYFDSIFLIMFSMHNVPVPVEVEIPWVNEFSLSPNFPNPFNPTTKISYQIPVLSFVTLKVYDVLGNEIAELVNEEKPAGSYEVEFSAIGGSASGGNAYNVTSGIYFYQLTTGNFIETKKMVLIK